MRITRRNQLFGMLATLVTALASLSAAEPPKAPVPSSPFLPVIYRYADTMIERGRDTQGPIKTGLFLSALDRSALALLTNRPPAPHGIREGDRVGSKEGPLVGANVHHDQNLLRLLYTLSELSGKPKYRDAADAELKWFFSDAPSTNMYLRPWGERSFWDTLKDEPVINTGTDGRQGFFRPWLLWDRCFDLAPQAIQQLALAVARSQSNAFPVEPPREAGFNIRMWALAYARTKDPELLKAIDTSLRQLEKGRSNGGPKGNTVAAALSLAIDCDGAAHHLPDPLASRLRSFAAREDEIFCGLPHNVSRTAGFLTGSDKQARKPTERHTPHWTADDARNTTAQIGMMCVSRYENTARLGYRTLVHAAADAYLDSMFSPDEDVWPATLGHAISLELAAWRSTSRPVYLDRARLFGNLALEKFFDKSPVPRASLKSNHYETITGADTLALALVELHLHILHITAVRYPPNTIDR
jgi:hypothetical protein